MTIFVLLIVITGGIALMVWGVERYKSADSDIAFFFTGSPTDASMGIVIGGALASLTGAGVLLHGPKVRRRSSGR